MSAWSTLAIRAVDGGLGVVVFALVGEVLKPKRFAGLFGAAPSVALANLAVTVAISGAAVASRSARGMILGAVAMASACGLGVGAVRRYGILRGSSSSGQPGLPSPRSASPCGHERSQRPPARRSPGSPAERERRGEQEEERRERAGPPMGIDLRRLRKSGIGDMAVRFAFGAAISVLADVVTAALGVRIGDMFLAAPAILPATLTLIERGQGRPRAVFEVSGAVMGAVALVGFALVAWALLGAVGAAVALLAALVAWIGLALTLYLGRSFASAEWTQTLREHTRADQGPRQR